VVRRLADHNRGRAPRRACRSLNAIASPAAFDSWALVTFVRSLTVENVDEIGLVVRRCTQCSAGKVCSAVRGSNPSDPDRGALAAHSSMTPRTGSGRVWEWVRCTVPHEMSPALMRHAFRYRLQRIARPHRTCRILDGQIRNIIGRPGCPQYRIAAP
jgi:hypothetical protein